MKSAGRPTVLVGFAEAMAAIETAWSLQRAGFRVVAFGRAGSRPGLRRVRGVILHEVPAPEQDARATVDAIRGLVRDLAPDAFLPLDDPAVWVSSRLDDGDVTIAGATGRGAEYALDKSLQLRAARDAGLLAPPTQVLNDLQKAEPISSPVIVKPAFALYELDGKLVRPTGTICADDRELSQAAATRWLPPVLIQPWIHGTGEGLFGHVGPNGVVAWSAHRRVRMVNPQGSASSACQSQPVDPALVEPSERFLRAIGWAGMFMLEFLRDSEGRPWFMELNGRAWGSMALARRRGFEYPAWTVQGALDADFEPKPPASPPDIFCRNLGLELVHLMFVARGPRSGRRTEWPRLSRAVRDVLRVRRGDRWYNFDRSAPNVMFADAAATVAVYLRKLLARTRS